jgi:hypothetical protein
MPTSQESESIIVSNVGQNLNFRRLTSRMETLEDTTEILARKVKGVAYYLTIITRLRKFEWIKLDL